MCIIIIKIYLYCLFRIFPRWPSLGFALRTPNTPSTFYSIMTISENKHWALCRGPQWLHHLNGVYRVLRTEWRIVCVCWGSGLRRDYQSDQPYIIWCSTADPQHFTFSLFQLFQLLGADSACGIIFFSLYVFQYLGPKYVGGNPNIEILDIKYKWAMMPLLVFFLFLHRDSVWLNSVATLITHLTPPVLTISWPNYSRCFFHSAISFTHNDNIQWLWQPKTHIYRKCNLTDIH